MSGDHCQCRSGGPSNKQRNFHCQQRQCNLSVRGVAWLGACGDFVEGGQQRAGLHDHRAQERETTRPFNTTVDVSAHNGKNFALCIPTLIDT